jgi:hypothetical protein
MNYLITVVGITIVSLLLASPFFLQTQKAYERNVYGQGYDIKEISDSDEATEQEEEAMEEAEENEDDEDDEDDDD